VVGFPQTPELSTGRPQTAKNHEQGCPHENDQLPVDENASFHTSTTPYYNYYVFMKSHSNRRRDNRL
jgi:hypothetical protein